MSLQTIVIKCQRINPEIGDYVRSVAKPDLTGYSVQVTNGSLQVSTEAEQDEAKNALSEDRIQRIAKTFRKN